MGIMSSSMTAPKTPTSTQPQPAVARASHRGAAKRADGPGRALHLRGRRLRAALREGLALLLELLETALDIRDDRVLLVRIHGCAARGGDRGPGRRRGAATTR